MGDSKHQQRPVRTRVLCVLLAVGAKSPTLAQIEPAPAAKGDLPAQIEKEPAPAKTHLRIELATDGTISLDGRPLPKQRALAQLRKAVQRSKAGRIDLAIARDCKAKVFTPVLKVIADSGADDVTIIALGEKEKP